MGFLEGVVGDGIRNGVGSLQFAEEKKKRKRRTKRVVVAEDRELFIAKKEGSRWKSKVCVCVCDGVLERQRGLVRT